MTTFLTSIMSVSSIVGKAITYTIGRHVMNSVSSEFQDSGQDSWLDLVIILVIAIGIGYFVYKKFFGKDKIN